MSWWHSTRIDFHLIEQLRARVYEYTYEHPGEIDLSDVQSRIPEDATTSNGENGPSDLMLKRFLTFCRPPFNVDSALQRFIEFFRFRASIGLCKLTTENTICREVWQMRLFLDEGVDREGNKLLIVRAKYYRKLPQSNYLMKRCLLYMIEQYDRMLEKGAIPGLSMLLDLTHFNYLQNVNLPLIHYAVQLQNHYIGLFWNAYAFNLPWGLTVLHRMVHSMLCAINGRENVRMFILDKSNIEEFIEETQRPAFLGGKLPISRRVPPDAIPFLRLVKILEEEEIVLEPKNVHKIDNYLQETLKIMDQVEIQH